MADRLIGCPDYSRDIDKMKYQFGHKELEHQHAECMKKLEQKQYRIREKALEDQDLDRFKKQVTALYSHTCDDNPLLHH